MIAQSIIELLKINLDVYEINDVKRLGKYDVKKFRSLVHYQTEIEIFKKCYKLKDSSIIICEYFSKQVIEERKHLVKYIRDAKQKGY